MGINLLVLCTLLALAIVAKFYIKANPTVMARRLKSIGGVACLVLGVLAVIRGVAPLGLALSFAGAWLLWPARSAPIPRAGQFSALTTEHLDVQLDHDSGLITGRVLKGMFANRSIESLRPAELALLWQDCRFVDFPSAQVLEAYLNVVHPSWQEDIARGEKEMNSGPDGKMTEKEALEILGLDEGAGEDDVRKAHRELMKRFHPDRGGSTYLASKINEAKTVLLKE